MDTNDITDDDIRGLLATTGPHSQRIVWIAASTALGRDFTGGEREIPDRERQAARRECAREIARRASVAADAAMIDRVASLVHDCKLRGIPDPVIAAVVLSDRLERVLWAVRS